MTDTKKLREELERLQKDLASMALAIRTVEPNWMKADAVEEKGKIEGRLSELVEINFDTILAALRAVEALSNAVKLLEIAQGILESEGFETAKEIGNFLTALASQQTPKGAGK